jgi:predicted outer membrane repeat protein
MFAKKSISRTFSALFVIIFVLSITPYHSVRAASTRFAKPSITGTGNCSSWGNACTLQTALTGAVSGDEIWVMTGTYRPTSGTDRTATFQLKNGVAIYGGFAGTEIARIQRNPSAYPTILSGDLGTTGNNSDNSYHVVTGSGTDLTASLNGFTITGGNANGTNPDDAGGGMVNNHGSPTLMNLIFDNNQATWKGGGMDDNTSSSPSLTNITFSNNSADSGGGMDSRGGNPTLTNVTFSGNSAANGGGGIANSSGSPTFTNVTFIGNSTPGYGGGMMNNGSNPNLTNVTLSNNSAYWGGGMYNMGIGPSHPTINNSILWGNTANSPANGPQIYNDSGSSVTITYSDVQDGGTFFGNINSDPLLGTLGNYGGFTQTIPLLSGSPAINTGDLSLANCPLTDQRGVSRPQGAHCDMGAFEFIPGPLYAASSGLVSGGCVSWSNACSLQYALSIAGPGNEIWTKAGTHKPTTGTDRTATFRLKNSMALYGGFAGTETALSQRNPAANLTILSGDLYGNDVGFTNNTENVYHVVTSNGTDFTAVLDGFVISGGNANDSSSPGWKGGGLLNDSGSPTVSNVTFSGNYAYYGGGMVSTSTGNPLLKNITFSNNTAVHGGGILNNGSSPTLINVTFSGNTTTDTGGGMENWGSNPVLTNTTFSSNLATNKGGCIYNTGGSNPTVRNSILWGNSAYINPQIFNDSSNPIITYSDIDGGYAGTGNIALDPLLGTLGNYGGFTQTIPLLSGSPAINSGNDAVCSLTDQRGVTRPQGAHCDMGAFEVRIYLITLPLILR